MFKKILYTLAFVLSIQAVIAQDGASIADFRTPPHESAMLDVMSLNKGVLYPQVTFDEMMAIAPVTDGLQVYVTTEGYRGLWYYDANHIGYSTTTSKWVRYGVDIEKLVPIGTIIMVNDNVCPAGWIAVPEAHGRFIVGADDSNQDYYAFNQDGEETVFLEGSNLKDHEHIFSGTATTLSAKETEHDHLVQMVPQGSKIGKFRKLGFNRGPDDAITEETNGETPILNSSHGHPIKGSIEGIKANTTDEVEGNAHENRPQYFALTFCMRNF